MRFRAAVLHRPGEGLRIETVELGALQPGDALVRIRATSLCHTDLEVIDGQLDYPMPIVLGHEAAGTVEAVGAAVTGLAPGDPVVLSWNPHCGHCFYCERDEPILCETYLRLGPRAVQFDGSARLSLAGAPVHHLMFLGSFAEFCVVPAQSAVCVPAGIPFDRACLIGCGVMTGVGAATRIARLSYGASALVVGCGAVGLSAVQGARLAGAGRIIAVDLDRRKLDLARRVGATDVIDGAAADALAAIRALTQGRGADHVFEAAGNASAFRLSAEAVRPGGQIVWLGKVNVNDDVASAGAR
jgi:S-(hydroxymethyl)glutathione dehydrogenase / alcohol dehydrogenase